MHIFARNMVSQGLKNDPDKDVFASEETIRRDERDDGFASVARCLRKRKDVTACSGGNGKRLFKPGTPVASGFLRRRGNIHAIRQ